MARRKVVQPAGRPRAERFEVEDARLVLSLRPNHVEADLRGALVRISTDATDTDQEVLAAAERARQAGAARVVVQPRPKGEQLPAGMMAGPEERHESVDAREAAKALVAESSYPDRVRLMMAVESLLDRAGV